MSSSPLTSYTTRATNPDGSIVTKKYTTHADGSTTIEVTTTATEAQTSIPPSDPPIYHPPKGGEPYHPATSQQDTSKNRDQRASTNSASSPNITGDCCTKCCEGFLRHIQRARTWRIPESKKPSKYEEGKLESTNPTVRAYITWRRSTLIVASPIVFFSMIMGFVNLEGQFEDTALNGFGKLLLLLTGIDSAVLFAAVVLASVYWNRLTFSTAVIKYGWFTSFLMPLLPAIFPLEMVIKESILDVLDDATIVGYKIIFALNYALTLFPVIITFPGGALRASLRIRWLLPNSSLAGWILTICAPFYSVTVCIALVMIIQVAGDSLLFIGVLLIVAAPWIYVYRSQYYIGVVSDKTAKQVLLTQRIIAAVTIAGAVLIVFWALTAEVSGIHPVGKKTDNDEEASYLLTYGQCLRLIFETIGRLLVTTILFCDGIASMTVRDWREGYKRREEIGEDVIAVDFEAFESVLPKTMNAMKEEKAANPEGSSNDIENNGTGNVDEDKQLSSR